MFWGCANSAAPHPDRCTAPVPPRSRPPALESRGKFSTRSHNGRASSQRSGRVTARFLQASLNLSMPKALETVGDHSSQPDRREPPDRTAPRTAPRMGCEKVDDERKLSLSLSAPSLNASARRRGRIGILQCDPPPPANRAKTEAGLGETPLGSLPTDTCPHT